MTLGRGSSNGPGFDAPDRQHPRARPLPHLPVPLGHQLGVGLDDDASRDAELVRETTRRGQQRARHQPPVLDRLPQLPFQLGAQPGNFVGLPLHVDVMPHNRDRGALRSTTWAVDGFDAEEQRERACRCIVSGQ